MGPSHKGVVLDFLDGLLIKSASIALEAILAIVGPLDAIVGITLGEAALVNIIDPLEVASEL